MYKLSVREAADQKIEQVLLLRYSSLFIRYNFN